MDLLYNKDGSTGPLSMGRKFPGYIDYIEPKG